MSKKKGRKINNGAPEHCTTTFYVPQKYIDNFILLLIIGDIRAVARNSTLMFRLSFNIRHRHAVHGKLPIANGPAPNDPTQL